MPANYLGQGEPSGPTGANNLTLLGYNQDQIVGTQAVGNSLVSSAESGLGDVQNYETQILSGNRGDILSAEAPEISSLLTSYDSQRKAQAELQPRGGGRSATLNEQPYKELGDVNKLIESARPQAAQQLTQTASAEGYLGAEEQGIAANDVSTSLNFLLGKTEVQIDAAKFQGEQGQALGNSIGAAIPELLALAGGG
jgi:hypothetical protein